MKTLQQLLDEGYKFVDNISSDFFPYSSIDYDALMDERFCYNKKEKIIYSIPLKPDITLKDIEICYEMDNGVVIGKMKYEEDAFKFTYNEEELKDVCDKLVFEYSSFISCLSSNLNQFGDKCVKVTLIITGVKSTGEEIMFKSYYYSPSFELNRPETYTGIECYFDGCLYSYSNVLLMYQLYDITDLKRKIESFCQLDLQE